MGISSKPVRSQKEPEMFKNRFLLMLGVASLLLVTMAVSNPRSNASLAADQGASDFYQRHPDWTWAINDQNVVIPATGDSAFPDYFQRHPELSAPVAISIDTTDYFFRHPELRAFSTKSIDLTDYFFRHPELRSASVNEADMTDYYFRHTLP